jgi:hypothetical protein
MITLCPHGQSKKPLPLFTVYVNKLSAIWCCWDTKDMWFGKYIFVMSHIYFWIYLSSIPEGIWISWDFELVRAMWIDVQYCVVVFPGSTTEGCMWWTGHLLSQGCYKCIDNFLGVWLSARAASEVHHRRVNIWGQLGVLEGISSPHSLFGWRELVLWNGSLRGVELKIRWLVCALVGMGVEEGRG